MNIFGEWLLKLDKYLRLLDRHILLALDNAGFQNNINFC
jgi:hypothetical protein